jgi:hypothetical protein
MPLCSICERPEAASIINEMLETRNALDVIAQQTGFHRSSIHRHSKRCFPLWKAARVKARRGKNDGAPGRIIVQWPDRAALTYCSRPIALSELRENDVLLRVEFEETPIARLGNPRAAPFDDRTAESFFDAARAEDAERAKIKIDNDLSSIA